MKTDVIQVPMITIPDKKRMEDVIIQATSKNYYEVRSFFERIKDDTLGIGSINLDKLLPESYAKKFVSDLSTTMRFTGDTLVFLHYLQNRTTSHDFVMLTKRIRLVAAEFPTLKLGIMRSMIPYNFMNLDDGCSIEEWFRFGMTMREEPITYRSTMRMYEGPGMEYQKRLFVKVVV